jgi:hypothetical protein
MVFSEKRRGEQKALRAALALLLPLVLFLAGCGSGVRPTPPPPVILFTPAVPNGTVGIAYDFLLQAIGGVGNFSWSVTAGALPDGITLNATTGILSGTPTVEADFTFTIQVDSGDQSNFTEFTVTIGTVPVTTLEIFTSALPNAGTDIAYTYTLQALGAAGPVSWTITGGVLPGGIALDTPTGVISGTPTESGGFAFTIQADDGVQTATRDFSITVVIVGPVPLEIPTLGLPSSTVDFAYNAALRATGGTGIYTWSIPTGALPDGLELDAFTGAITGTPTVPGTFPFTVSVLSGDETLDQPFSIRIGDAINPRVELVSVATDGTPGNGGSGDATLTPDGRFVVFTSFADNLTTGDTNSNVDIFVRDRTCVNGVTGITGVTERISIASLTVATISLPDGTVDAPYGAVLAAIGGDAPFTWTITVGGLPAGLTLDASTGSISGAPTATGTSGFTVQVTDSSTPQQTAVRDFTISIAPAAPPPPGDLTISTDTLPDGVRDQPYSFTLQSAGGTGALTWTLSGGSLPEGLLLDESTGTISGTPTVAVLLNFLIEVTDSSDPAQTTTKVLSLRILPDGNETNVATFLPAVSALTPTASGDFLFVSFVTDASNLVAGDTNNARDVFVTAIQVVGAPTCTLTRVHTARVSVATDGTEGDGDSTKPSISADGRFVVYQSNATNFVAGDDSRITDVYLTELAFAAGTVSPVRTTLISFLPILTAQPTTLFSETTIGNASLILSPNAHVGQKIEITSGTGLDQLRIISGNDASTFTVDPAWDIIPDSTSVFRIFSTPSAATTRGQISANGQFQGFSSTGTFGEPNDPVGSAEVFLRDGASGALTRASVHDDGTPGSGTSNLHALSGNGNLVLFTSTATNLVTDDTNFARDLFLHDSSLAQTTRVHVANDLSEPNGPIGASAGFSIFESAGMSTSGNLIVYESSATNLVVDDFNSSRDVFLFDRNAGTVTRVSVGMDGVEPRGSSSDVTISLDGTTIVFTSDAPNMVPNDTNKANDLFLFPTNLPAESPLFITATLAEAEQGIVFEDYVKVASGQAPLYFAIAEGQLPAGLSLDSRSGRLTGIPQETGVFSFTVLVMDSTRPSASARRTFTLTVHPQ